MNMKDVRDRFNELLNEENFICSCSELQDFILCGLILKSKDSYITRDNKTLSITVLEDKDYEFNIDFTMLLIRCNDLIKEAPTKKVYFMSKHTYNEYKEKGLIINLKGKEYYRLFENENWLVDII